MSLFNNTQGGGTGGASASIFVTGFTEADTVTATKDGRTVKGKWVTKANPKYVGLPDGYTQLEYIQSTGTQYLDTGVTGGTNASFEMTARLVETNANNNNQFFGAVSNFCSVNCARANASSPCGFRVQGAGDKYPYVMFSTTPQEKWSIRVEDNGDVYLDNHLSGTLSEIAGRGWGGETYANQIFVTADDGLPYATSAELYSLKMYADGVALRDFIPCINPSGEIGLYDLVSETFFGNSGTGTFLAGAEISSTVDGHTITIKDYGLWTVTATNGEHTVTQDVLVDVAMDYEIEMSYAVNYLMLYDYGDECEEVTGGYSITYQYSGRGSLTKNSDHMVVVGGASSWLSVSGSKALDGADNFTKAFGVYSNSSSGGSVMIGESGDISNAVTAKWYGLATLNAAKALDYYCTDIYSVNNDLNVPTGTKYANISAINTTATIYCFGFTKADDYATLCSKANISVPSDLATLIADAASIDAILSNETAVKHMVSSCTGDFMASFVASSACLSALDASPHKSVVMANKHWKKFLAMVGVTA